MDVTKDDSRNVYYIRNEYDCLIKFQFQRISTKLPTMAGLLQPPLLCKINYEKLRRI